MAELPTATLVQILNHDLLYKKTRKILWRFESVIQDVTRQ